MQDYLSIGIAVSLWGMVMALYETNARAAIADILPESKRAFGYGVFGLVFGVTWMIGSLIYGFIYENYPPLMVYFALLVESLAFVLLIALVKMHTKEK